MDSRLFLTKLMYYFKGALCVLQSKNCKYYIYYNFLLIGCRVTYFSPFFIQLDVNYECFSRLAVQFVMMLMLFYSDMQNYIAFFIIFLIMVEIIDFLLKVKNYLSSFSAIL